MWKKMLRSSVNFLPFSLRQYIKDLPIIARFQRWVFNKALAGQSFIHTINAGPAKGLIYPVTLPQDKAIWSGTYESQFASALAEVVRVSDVCYDVGGFRGFMGGVCARARSRLVVIFEPLPENCKQIRRMAELNPDLTIRLEPVAVGDRDGQVEFKIMPEESMGKLTDSPFQPAAAAAASMTVPIRRLDSLVAEGLLPPPNVIKIDVEGAELLVLRGALHVLRQNRPDLLIEAHSSDLARACTNLLESLGYRISVLEKVMVPKPRSDPEVSHLLAQPEAGVTRQKDRRCPAAF